MSYPDEEDTIFHGENGANGFAHTGGKFTEPHPYDNPLHIEQIHAGRMRNVPGDAFNGDYLNFGRVEVASLCCCMFALLALVGVINAINPSSMHLVQTWAAQSWVQGHCEVEAVGIAYRGNCDTDVTLSMTTYGSFAECMGLPEKLGNTAKSALNEWRKSPAGLCAARGDKVFRMDTGEKPSDEAEEDAIGRSSLPKNLQKVVDPINLPNALQERFLPGARIDCHNNYLPWALLHVDRSLVSRVPGDNDTEHAEGLKRCAYEFGASQPSLTGDWEDIMEMVGALREERDSLLHGGRGKVRCWVLQSDDCVVAYMDQRQLVAAAQRKHTMSTLSGVLCGTLALSSLTLGCCWHFRERGFCHHFPAECMNVVCCEPSGGFHHSLPTQDPDGIMPGIPLTDRVRQAVTAAAGNFSNRDGDPGTPLSSVSGDGRRALVHNVASDFLQR